MEADIKPGHLSHAQFQIGYTVNCAGTQLKNGVYVYEEIKVRRVREVTPALEVMVERACDLKRGQVAREIFQRVWADGETYEKIAVVPKSFDHKGAQAIISEAMVKHVRESYRYDVRCLDLLGRPITEADDPMRAALSAASAGMQQAADTLIECAGIVFQKKSNAFIAIDASSSFPTAKNPLTAWFTMSVSSDTFARGKFGFSLARKSAASRFVHQFAPVLPREVRPRIMTEILNVDVLRAEGGLGIDEIARNADAGVRMILSILNSPLEYRPANDLADYSDVLNLRDAVVAGEYEAVGPMLSALDNLAERRFSSEKISDGRLKRMSRALAVTKGALALSVSDRDGARR